MRTLKAVTMIAVLAMLAFGITASATVLPPGGSGVPSYMADLVPSGSFTIAADTGIQSYNTGDASGVWREYVLRDTVTGYLSFIISFTNDSGNLGVVHSVTTANFGGFTVDAGYSDYCCPGGTAIPTGVEFALSGTVGFSFFPGVPGGNGSYWLVINTNAYDYTSGVINFINDNVDHLVAYAPAPGVPEPTSLVLFGSGLVGLANMVRRRLFS